jgi:N-acetylmuramic acid 6-phosphate etherase
MRFFVVGNRPTRKIVYMAQYDDLIRQLANLATEQINPTTRDIDCLTPLEIARKINDEDKKVAHVVEEALESIATAALTYAETLRNGGRVFYIGAGTSGRLGVLDAAECPPTFGTDPDQIVGVISGGYDTLVLSQEGVEDDINAAVVDLKTHNFCPDDFLIGIAASTRTPYTLAGLEYACSIGASTAFIICNKVDQNLASQSLFKQIDHLIPLPVGPEAITGSTRMKSGTAQKLTLNTISTTAMVLLGKTLGNLMVDLQSRSEKLAARSRKILMDIFDISSEQSGDLLEKGGGSVKLAIVMRKFDCSRPQAEQKLRAADGFISKIKTRR